MSTADVTLVEASYAAFDVGDTDALRQLWAPDIEWHEPPEVPFGGTYRGTEAVLSYLTSLSRHYLELRLHPELFVEADGGRVFVVGYARGRTRLGPVEIAFTHECTVRDGRLVRFHDRTSSAKILIGLSDPAGAQR